MKRIGRLGLLLLIFLLITLSLVSAWGLNPARQRAEYTIEQQYLSLTIENPQHIEGYFKIAFSGELASYADYTGPIIYLSSEMSEYVIPFTITLPQDLVPGSNKLSVIVQQIPGGATTNTISSLMSLVADVTVDVPISGNYITTQLSIGVAEADDPTPITLSILNKGEGSVVVWADVSIKGPTNEELASWVTEEKTFAYMTTGKIVTSWDGEKNPGMYQAEVTVHYADKVQVLRKTFVVGKRQVVADSISAEEFSLGSIVPLDIFVRNKWNEDIPNVFAEIFVLSKQGNVLHSMKTASENVALLGRAVLNAYWDTSGLVVGAYDLNVVVHFDEGVSQQSFPVVVKESSLEVQSALTGQVSAINDGNFSQNSVFILIMLVLIITNIIIIMYFRKMKKKKKL